MLDTHSAKAILVDFGAAIKFEIKLFEFTHLYLLDVLPTSLASEKVDWTCLGSTIAELSGMYLLKGLT